MKTLIKIALIAIVAVLGYNYFYGDEKEQEQAEKIVGKVQDLGSDIKALVLNEKEKFDDGKYDNAVDKFSELIASVKEKISNIDMDKLEEKKEKLKESIEKLKEKGESIKKEDTQSIEEDMESLFEDLKGIIENIENK